MKTKLCPLLPLERASSPDTLWNYQALLALNGGVIRMNGPGNGKDLGTVPGQKPMGGITTTFNNSYHLLSIYHI